MDQRHRIKSRMPESILYTVGHSNHPIEAFLDLLQRHGIEVLADVRSMPSSRHNPQYNKPALDLVLARHGIRYVFLGRELGARREEPGAWEGNTVSYDRTARLPAFREGLDWIRDNVDRHRLALMCAEKEPLHCHRTLLIGRELRGEFAGRIRHILADGRLEAHEDLEQRLIAQAGLDSAQEDLFSGAGETTLDRAYRQQR